MAVYAMQSTDGGPVKIGTTVDVASRRRALECHYRCELVILATMEGGRVEERAIHERFAHLRLGKTEQFRPDPDLMSFIGKPLLVGANPGAIGAMPSRSTGSTVRLTDDAIKWARIASGYTGEAMAEYVSRIVVERGNEDIELLHAKRGEKPSKSKGGKS